MIDFHPKNERLKKNYTRFLREADRKAETTVRGVERALNRLEEYTRFAPFESFNSEQAISFKKYLMTSPRAGSDKPLCLSTVNSTLNDLKKFFKWLACQPGYKSKIKLTDIEYLNLSRNEARAARSGRSRDFPSIEQVRHVIFTMPLDTEIDHRDQALIACALLTGMRDGALASVQIRHFDLVRKLVIQDPREVHTKFRKRIDTFFLPLGDDLEGILERWLVYLTEERMFGPNAPAFPRTALKQAEDLSFVANSVEPEFWKTTTPVREIFRKLFTNAGLPYFNPHSLRTTLTHWAERNYTTPEEFKAFSQNLGHEKVSTTFESYGSVARHRQGELIRAPREDQQEDKATISEILRLLKKNERKEDPT